MFDFVGFGFASVTLDIDAVGDSVLGEDVVAALDAEFETQMGQQMNEIRKGNVGVRGAAENALENFRRRRHEEG